VVGIPDGATITALVAGPYHTCAIADDEVYCWGGPPFGGAALGLPEHTVWSRTAHAVGLHGAKELALGTSHSCARTDTNVLCWGWNDEGQLGSGQYDLLSSSTPLPVVTYTP
jgi:alpha-tubulin suppressor-like RCC1 family protein